MKIIVVTKNWLGDMLFQLPAIEALRRRYPEAEIVCIAPERCREILEAQPMVNRVIPFDEKESHRSLMAKIRFALKLRREKWDQAYLFHRSRTRALLMLFAGVKERIGYKAGPRALTKTIDLPPAGFHQVDHFLYLMEQAGVCPPSRNTVYRFSYSKKAEESAAKILQKYQLTPKSFVCFHLGSNWKPKRWPSGYFAKLADMIAQAESLPVVITGSSKDLSLFQEMMASIKTARIISLTGTLNLEQLGAIFKESLFVVSGDSGPMHIASGVGTPVVAIFGPTDPVLTGPRGTGKTLVLSYVPEGYQVPWYGTEMPKGGWLSQIHPETVFKAIVEKGWIKESIASKNA